MAEAVNIKEQIRLLVQLQSIDTQIYNLKKIKEQLPAEFAILQKSFENKKALLNSLEEKSKNLISKRKEKELDLASKEENIKKLNSLLYALKTNKEYQAMLEQIGGLKADNSVTEEDILKIMEEQDGLKEEVDKEKQHLKEEEKKYLEEKKKVEEKLKEIEYSISELTAKRAQAEDGIDKRILSNYERILKGKDGLALVKIKDASCQGCFMNVTPQLVNEIKMLEKIMTCQACARMLYIEEDL